MPRTTKGKRNQDAARNPVRAPTITRPEFLVAGTDDAFREFIYGFLIVSTRMERLRDRIGELIGVNGLQYHILSVVAEHSTRGPVTVGEVAAVLDAGQSHVTMETGKLVRRGLLAKTRNPQDGRSTLLELSDQGRAAMEALAPKLQAINDVLFAGLSKRDFNAYRALTAQMVVNTREALDTAKRTAPHETKPDAAA